MRGAKYRALTAQQIKPEGWLLRQLEIQAEGLSGHLDLVWPDVRESKWIGGDKEGWERVPYWLDGFIPLAYLLDDEDLKKRAKRYIDAILAAQKEDGWICPCELEERDRYDLWAAFLICKVLVLYQDCSGDERIEEAVYRALKQLLPHIARNTLFNWSAARWYECLIPILWMYERRPEPWLLQLMELLDADGIDYEKLYTYFDFQKPVPKKYWTQTNHVVNTAMAFKCRALMSCLTEEDPDEFALSMYQKLMKYNSMATGHFTGDECLSGDAPIQGSECCSVAEMMYSCETLLSIGGNPFWGDLLEREAFNSMPATTTPDMWAHQYLQMTNQISAARIPDAENPYNSNNNEANMFGLEPHFGCCTANFNQAWPKFAISAVMKNDRGPVVQSLVPCCAQVETPNGTVQVHIVSKYPFRDNAVIELSSDKPAETCLQIRIPGFAKKATVNGKEACPGTYFEQNILVDGVTCVPVELTFDAVLQDRPYDAKVLVRGPLLFSLPVKAKVNRIEYVRDGVERRFPYCDYEMFPDSEWNYGFYSEAFEVMFEPVTDTPFSVENPPIRIKAKMAPVPWEEKGGICAISPTERKALGEAKDVLLQPYGCTNLRMTEMPYIKQ